VLVGAPLFKVELADGRLSNPPTPKCQLPSLRLAAPAEDAPAAESQASTADAVATSSGPIVSDEPSVVVNVPQVAESISEGEVASFEKGVDADALVLLKTLLTQHVWGRDWRLC
jgi:hypothetical protein